MSERTQAQEERTRSPHRDACRDQVEGLHCLFKFMEEQLVDPDRPPSSSRAEEECGNTRTPRWALYPHGGGISTKGGVVTPAWFYNRPLYPAHVDASDSEFFKLLPVSGTGFPESWRSRGRMPS